MADLPKDGLDARKFQNQLDHLADTLAFKIQREGAKALPIPRFVVPDLYFLLRVIHRTYELFFYLNADDTRNHDPGWRVYYGAVSLPLVRTMIDAHYNVTTILESPGKNGYRYREGGYKQILVGLDEDELAYGNDPAWVEWISAHRKLIQSDMRLNGFSEPEIRKADWWPTLSQYASGRGGLPLTPHQQSLKNLTLTDWREYSGLSHAMFQGNLLIASFLVPKDFEVEERNNIETTLWDNMLALHIPRIAGILLCTLTEIQAYFRFDDANFNSRLCEIWRVLIPLPAVKELYDGRYARLMQDRGISGE